jgi:hypothetical protein
MTPIIGPRPHTPEWHDIHRRIVSGTAVARIMAGGGYDLYLEMRGEKEPFKGNALARSGLRHEMAILGDYADAANVYVANGLPFLIDPDCPQLGVSPDAVAINLPDGCTPEVVTATAEANWYPLLEPGAWGVEAKQTKSREVADQLGDDDSDEVLPKWIWQVQSQMAVTGWSQVVVAVHLYGGLRPFVVLRHEDMIQQCRSLAVEYTDRVAKGLPPEIVFENEANRDAIKSLYKPVVGKVIDLDASALDVVTKWRDASAAESAAKKAKEAYNAELVTMLDGAALATLPDGATIKFGTVDVAEKVVPSYSYRRLWYTKSKTK